MANTSNLEAREPAAERSVFKTSSFEEFWPHYVLAHSRPGTQAMHAVSSVAPLALAGLAAWTRNGWWLLAIPVVAYGIAWISHFFIEHNRPATWDNVWFSLRGDYRMLGLTLTGRMPAEVERARRAVQSRG